MQHIIRITEENERRGSIYFMYGGLIVTYEYVTCHNSITGWHEKKNVNWQYMNVYLHKTP